MTTRVLAIDDSKTMRNLLKAALVQAGFEVDLAKDGREGLERLKEFQPHVVITDINMPVMDGFEFIKSARRVEIGRFLPILVLTTESAASLKEKARKHGATGWIVKPFDEEKLVSAISRVATE